MNTKQLETKLEALRKERRVLSMEFGEIARTPKSAPGFSYYRLDTLEKKLEKLNAEIEELITKRAESQLADQLAACKQ